MSRVLPLLALTVLAPVTAQPFLGQRGLECTNTRSKDLTRSGCDGWVRVGQAACISLCQQNQLPSGCVRPTGYRCSVVVWDDNPSFAPGWCQVSDDTCQPVAATSQTHYLLRLTTTAPTSAPTTAPTITPTSTPTTAPTAAPTVPLTSTPTSTPTTTPTSTPTTAPTITPTSTPTTAPASTSTTAPTSAPTITSPPTPTSPSTPTSSPSTPTTAPSSAPTPSTASTLSGSNSGDSRSTLYAIAIVAFVVTCMFSVIVYRRSKCRAPPVLEERQSHVNPMFQPDPTYAVVGGPTLPPTYELSVTDNPAYASQRPSAQSMLDGYLYVDTTHFGNAKA